MISKGSYVCYVQFIQLFILNAQYIKGKNIRLNNSFNIGRFKKRFLKMHIFISGSVYMYTLELVRS